MHLWKEIQLDSMKLATGNTLSNERSCVLIKLHMQKLKFEFHIIVKSQHIIFPLIIFKHFENIKTVLACRLCSRWLEGGPWFAATWFRGPRRVCYMWNGTQRDFIFHFTFRNDDIKFWFGRRWCCSFLINGDEVLYFPEITFTLSSHFLSL